MDSANSNLKYPLEQEDIDCLLKANYVYKKKIRNRIGYWFVFSCVIGGTTTYENLILNGLVYLPYKSKKTANYFLTEKGKGIYDILKHYIEVL